MAGNERKRKMEENEATGKMITEWMYPTGFCGRTAYGMAIRTNLNWCKCEVERLAAKGVQAYIGTNEDGLIAIFRQ